MNPNRLISLLDLFEKRHIQQQIVYKIFYLHESYEIVHEQVNLTFFFSLENSVCKYISSIEKSNENLSNIRLINKLFKSSSSAMQGSKRASFLWPGPAQRGPAKVVTRPARSSFSAARPDPARGFSWPTRPGPGLMEIFLPTFFHARIRRSHTWLSMSLRAHCSNVIRKFLVRFLR